MKIYDLYRGNEFIKKGTLRELSDYTLLHQGSLLNYSYQKYLEKNKTNNVLKVYLVGDSNARK
ncbi:hypothetical protein [Lentibacillus amyloliquefaciens]|uniref:Uncharacterized protein n=1 Tax=Lentibacillus amyloliquefaciens TaxID=1472767 RepID=A0A0U4GCH9_9BACI|nr:hypothetical protein [Lentibacillus amyloliquefaciens]ALX50442.1 hypothetical protein AOX59_18770 [Lentibacillus amyloliquefaciens]